MTPIDYETETGKFVKLPKVGEPDKEFKIKTCRRVEGEKSRFNFQKTENQIIEGNEVEVTQDLGFRYEFETDDGKTFSIGSWKPYFAFKDANVQDGDHIRVCHPDKGVWKVEVIKRGLDTSAAEETWNA